MEIAGDADLLRVAEQGLIGLVNPKRSEDVKNSRISFYTVIMHRAGREPCPVDESKLHALLAVMVASGYTTADDYLSSIISYARPRGVLCMSEYELSGIREITAKLRKKGLFAHSQKRPVFLGDIQRVKDKKDRCSLLIAFFFGLRKSEALLFGDKLIMTEGRESFMMDFRGAVLKSNNTTCTRVKCLCGTDYQPFCLHSFSDVIGEVKEIDITGLVKRYFSSGETSHSLRIGTTVHCVYANEDSARILAHLRWSSPIMLIYYSRNSRLWERPTISPQFLY